MKQSINDKEAAQGKAITKHDIGEVRDYRWFCGDEDFYQKTITTPRIEHGGSARLLDTNTLRISFSAVRLLALIDGGDWKSIHIQVKAKQTNKTTESFSVVISKSETIPLTETREGFMSVFAVIKKPTFSKFDLILSKEQIIRLTNITGAHKARIDLLARRKNGKIKICSVNKN